MDVTEAPGSQLSLARVGSGSMLLGPDSPQVADSDFRISRDSHGSSSGVGKEGSWQNDFPRPQEGAAFEKVLEFLCWASAL